MAKLAGVPESVLIRAREIAEELEGGDSLSVIRIPEKQEQVPEKKASSGMNQLSIFDTVTTFHSEDILFELRDIDLSRVTPMDAMNLVYKWQNELKDKW